MTIGDLVSPIPRSDPARVWMMKLGGSTNATMVRYWSMSLAAPGASGGMTNWVAGLLRGTANPVRRNPKSTENPRHFRLASRYFSGSFSPKARLTMAVAATPTAMLRLTRSHRVVVAAPMAVRASPLRCWTK